jgi:hypothetical protein
MTTSLLQRCLIAHRHRSARPPPSSASWWCSRNFGPSTFNLNQTDAASPRIVISTSEPYYRRGGDFTGLNNTLHLRHLSTKVPNDDDNINMEIFLNDDEHSPPDDFYDTRFTPRNDHQRKLVEYTNYLLEDKDYPVGSLPLTHLVRISNCIDSWIASGEHRYLGAQQAELLVKRLICERGRGNFQVTWDMYHLQSVRIHS